MSWFPIAQTASALITLGILTAGALALKRRLKRRIRRVIKEFAYV